MQVKPVYEEIPDFLQMAVRLVEKYPDRFGRIEVNRLIAYGITNKERKEDKGKVYGITGETEPQSFTNSKTYFVEMYMSDWDARSEAARLLIVASALSRIDVDNPGKVFPLDYKDQTVMVKTFGAEWENKSDIPHLLNDRVEFND